MKPKVVIVPWLYGDKEVEKIKMLFRHHKFKIVNLQCEQILSKKWIEAGYHFPKGAAQKASHICWGKRIVERLKGLEIDNKNLWLTGAISTDFDRGNLIGLFKNKDRLSEEFNLHREKNWLLFISSFSFTTLSKEEIEEITFRTKVDNSNFAETAKKSKTIILDWLITFARNHPNYEIIYRPHPNEKNDISLIDLMNDIPNFHVISSYSVGQWIYCCDYINNWISTSIVDAIFMKKNASLVRPLPIEQNSEIELFYNSNYISSYQEFCLFNEGKCDKNFEIDISDYYLMDADYSFMKICNFLENYIKDPDVSLYSSSPKRIKFFKSLIAYSCYYTNFFGRLTKNNVLMEIYREIGGSKKYQKEFIKSLSHVFGKDI